MAALGHILKAGAHVVAQVVKPKLVVGGIGDVGTIGRALFAVGLARIDHARAQPQRGIDLAHPVGVAARQIVVDGDDMHPLAGQRVQIGRKGGDQCLAFAGLHFGDVALMQEDATDQLHIMRAQTKRAARGLAAIGEGFGQKRIKAFAAQCPHAQIVGFGDDLAVGLGAIIGLQRVDPGHQRADRLNLAVVRRPKDHFRQRTQSEHLTRLFVPWPSARAVAQAGKTHMIVWSIRVVRPTAPVYLQRQQVAAPIQFVKRHKGPSHRCQRGWTSLRQSKGTRFMKKFIASVALSALFALPVSAQDSVSADTVLATVNGTEITLGHVISMVRLLPAEYQGLPDNVLFDGLLEQLVQQQVLASVAEGELGRTEQLGLENERRAFLAATYVDRIGSAPVSDEELQAEFDAQFASAGPVKEYNASHILVETQADADAVIAALAEGADFAQVAQERSIGPSGPNGGDLGWFTAGMMVPSFEEAVFALDLGEVSSPVETQFGWHVIVLNDAREQVPPTLDDVRAELEEGLRRARVEAMLQDLTAAATIARPEIQIDPSVIRDLDLLAE